MKIIAWILIGIICLILVALLYYLIVGAIIFHFSLGRKELKNRVKKNNLKNNLEKYKIDLCWWDNLPFKKVSVLSFDNLKLVGHYLDLKSDRTVILVHGYSANYKEMQQYAKFFHQKNFNILCVENRGHGESEGSFVGMGWTDRKDLMNWIDFLNKESSSKIVVMGISMGASAVCCLSGEKLPSNVVGLIADSPFDNAEREIKYVLRKAGIFKNILVKHLRSYAKRIHGFDLAEADMIKCVKKTKTPILYIHGKLDTYVLPENSINLYNSTSEFLREIVLVDEAGHVMSYPVLGNLYECKINNFFKKFHIFD